MTVACLTMLLTTHVNRDTLSLLFWHVIIDLNKRGDVSDAILQRQIDILNGNLLFRIREFDKMVYSKLISIILHKLDIHVELIKNHNILNATFNIFIPSSNPNSNQIYSRSLRSKLYYQKLFKQKNYQTKEDDRITFFTKTILA